MSGKVSSEHVLHGLRGKAASGDLDLDWLEEVKARKVVCMRCHGVRSMGEPLDIVIRGAPPKATKVFVPIVEHSIIERRLLDIIGWDVVGPAVVISRLFDGSGKEYGEFCVIRPRQWICIRANRVGVDSGPLHCPQCGRCFGTIWGNRRVYVVRTSLGEGPLWASNLHSLLVDEEVYQRLRTHRWRRLIFDRIPIVDKPRDGLPEHIEHYVPVTGGGVDWFFDK